jgi:carboxyl-terminal processing protease
MRYGAMLSLCLLGTNLLAAPVPRQPPPPAKTLSEPAAQELATHLEELINYIHGQYVRPISKADLTYAALAGTFEAAQAPVPRDLRKRIEQVIGKESLPEAPLVPVRGAVNPQFNALLVAVVKEAGAGGALEGQRPLLAAAKAMTRLLDPHSMVLSIEAANIASGLNQTYVGLGLEADVFADRVVLRTVQPGGPAQRAGLLPGDVVVRVDGRPVDKWGTEELRARLQQVASPEQPSHTSLGKVVLTVRDRRRKGEHEVTVDRECFRPETVLGVARRGDNSWEYWLDKKNGIAHVRVGPLSNGTANELREVVAQLRSDGMRGLLLDLRWCPGGFIVEASAMAEMFLGPCLVCTVKSRSGEEPYRSDGAAKFEDFPIIVLISPSTSGGGELIASALQDHNRAHMAGQRSRGKGSVQNSFSVGDVGLRLTTGTFYRATGKGLHRFADSRPEDDWGVRPELDLEVRLSTELTRQLENWWLLQSLRPESSHEALPLDDPEVDVQRAAAWSALRAMLQPKSPKK